MVALVEWSGGVTPMFFAAAAIYTFFAFLGHEAMHVLAFLVVGQRPSISVGVEYLGIAVTPSGAPPRWQVALACVAPTLWAVIGMYGFSQILAFPINWRIWIVIGLFLVIALPSPGDIYTALMYHPDAAPQGVAADG